MAFWRKKSDQAKAAAVCDPSASPYAVFQDAGLSIGDRTVLEGISLSLIEHRIGIVGLNGSGKSTFVRLLNGLRLADTGRVQLFGAEATAARAELPRHVGFVFQNPDHQAIFPTVEEEIAFGLSQLGHAPEESREKARRFLKQHECDVLGPRPIAELSGGQKQLVCILAVLVMEPQVLVLDEPLTSLDGLASRRLFSKLMSLPQRIVMISHDLDRFERFDRVLWLEDGKLRMDGPPARVLPAYRNDILSRAGDAGDVVML